MREEGSRRERKYENSVVIPVGSVIELASIHQGAAGDDLVWVTASEGVD